MSSLVSFNPSVILASSELGMNSLDPAPMQGGQNTPPSVALVNFPSGTSPLSVVLDLDRTNPAVDLNNLPMGKDPRRAQSLLSINSFPIPPSSTDAQSTRFIPPPSLAHLPEGADGMSFVDPIPQQQQQHGVPYHHRDSIASSADSSSNDHIGTSASGAFDVASTIYEECSSILEIMDNAAYTAATEGIAWSPAQFPPSITALDSPSLASHQDHSQYFSSSMSSPAGQSVGYAGQQAPSPSSVGQYHQDLPSTASPALAPQIPPSSAPPGGDDDAAFSETQPSQQEQQQPAPAKKHGRKLPKPVTDFLKKWLLDHADHPYPNDQEKKMLCEQTQLSATQLGNWMINGRRRILVPAGRGGPASSGPVISSTPYSITHRPTSSAMASAHARRTAPMPTLAGSGGGSSSSSGGMMMSLPYQQRRPNPYPHQHQDHQDHPELTGGMPSSSLGPRLYRGMTIPHTGGPPPLPPLGASSFPPIPHHPYASRSTSVSPALSSSPGVPPTIAESGVGYQGGDGGAGALPQGYASTFPQAQQMAAYTMGGYQFTNSAGGGAGMDAMVNWTAAGVHPPARRLQRRQHLHNVQPHQQHDLQQQQYSQAAVLAYQQQFQSFPQGYPGPGPQ